VRKCFCILSVYVTLTAAAQPALPPESIRPADSTARLHPQRKWLATGATVLGYGGSFVLLNKAWYKDYPRSSFHTFNDGGEWMQMDKIGHAWTAYAISRAATSMWDWAGVQHPAAIALGSGSSLLYQLSIEYLDGRSAQWGWSWADVGADLFGTSLFAAQELGWRQQKLMLKFSVHHKKYPEASLQTRADALFGKSLPERWLKDYNRQTYWLSGNLQALMPQKKIIPWLNIAIGYGAEGMFGGYENRAFDKDGNVVFDRRDIKRYRQWYLAPDMDLTKIKTRSPFLRTILFLANSVKIPSPAIELSNRKLKFRAIVF
jgi:uncharacterized protein YfiM (DUF2279 family)